MPPPLKKCYVNTKTAQITDPWHVLIDNFDASIHLGTISNDNKHRIVSFYNILWVA